jgi:adenylosuccinate synthase
MRRGVIVQGLGFGDEGKGATVDFLTRELSAELVVRHCGGSQAGHNVVLPDGRSHTFSQFGAGTLAGVATYLGRQMIIHPRAMHREAAHLLELTGEDPFQQLQVHPQALVTTVYHQELNRLRELSRGAKRHGSCGHGIGETRSYWLKYGSDAIFAADLHDDESLEPKLELLRQRALLEMQEFIAAVPLEESFRTSIFRESTAQIVRELRSLGRPLELSATIPAANMTIFEGAQGILLDEWRGFHPHTTWSTVTLQSALDLAEELGIQELCTLGLTRAYTTRHGAGPLPTFDPELDALLNDPGNPRNPWQGRIRFGWLDLMLLRYAADAAGGPLDGIVVNGLDQLDDGGIKLCTSYQTSDQTKLGELPVAPIPCLSAQEKLTTLLKNVAPVYERVTANVLCQRLASELAPLAISGSGRTWKERAVHQLRFRPFSNPSAEVACNQLEKLPC